LETEQTDDSHLIAETDRNILTLAVEKQYEWAYDENMKIDFNSKAQSFLLRSDNQIFNPRMKLKSL
jgi:uncharacterized protein YqkB